MDIWSSVSSVILSCFYLFLSKRKLRNVQIILETLPRDLKCGLAVLKVIVLSALQVYFNETAITLFRKRVKDAPSKPCIMFKDEVWTFKQVDDYSNRISCVFHEEGFRKGDVVGVFVTNRPEYPCIWLGLAKIGVVSALINSNLKNKPLSHCINAAGCKAIVFSHDLKSAIFDIRNQLSGDIKYFLLGQDEESEKEINLNKVLERAPKIPKVSVKINSTDILLYVYTSGTTGLPKAAIFPHSRFLAMSLFAKYMIGITSNDIVYDPLPLYHTAGGLVGVGTAIITGGTVVLRDKFSATNFIPDCIKYQCTVAQYIGEICRYVLAVPNKPSDKLHKLRMIVGNGLRPAIWSEFIKRFNIPIVKEMYGSTEGNLQFVSMDNKIGAVGSIPRFLPFSNIFGLIIRVNADTMEPIRGNDGLCIQCDIDEPGMFVGIIPWEGISSAKEFHGYLDVIESKKKYIFDVCRKGDKAFVSGDLIVMDEYGYIYFKDRTGDTFRWKGENVSTSEVESIISCIIGLKDCIVYGVKVGELEGRAGMAALADPLGSIDLNKLLGSLSSMLPSYAHPLFIRLISETESTGTFKFNKINLVKDGFNPSVIKDPLFFQVGKTYSPLTMEIYDQIMTGKIKL